MRLSNPITIRQQWYDRAAKVKGASASGFGTTMALDGASASYTVPANKTAILHGVSCQETLDSAPTTAGFRGAEISIDGGGLGTKQIQYQLVRFAAIGDRLQFLIEPQAALEAGTIVAAKILSAGGTGGTITSRAAIRVTEFDA